jgi:hypothetical protein
MLFFNVLLKFNSFCISRDSFSITQDSFYIKLDSFCISQDSFSIKQDSFCIKLYSFYISRDSLCITQDTFRTTLSKNTNEGHNVCFIKKPSQHIFFKLLPVIFLSGILFFNLAFNKLQVFPLKQKASFRMLRFLFK